MVSENFCVLKKLNSQKHARQENQGTEGGSERPDEL